jgi:hypothetical protein
MGLEKPRGGPYDAQTINMTVYQWRKRARRSKEHSFFIRSIRGQKAGVAGGALRSEKRRKSDLPVSYLSTNDAPEDAEEAREDRSVGVANKAEIDWSKVIEDIKKIS